MKPILFLCTFVLAFTTFRAQTIDPDYIDGHIYLKLQDTSSLELVPYANNVPVLNTLFAQFGLDSISKPFRSPQLSKVYRLEFSNAAGIGLLLPQLQLLSFVEIAEKVPLMRPTYTPNDLQAQQWHLDKIRARLAWDLSRGNSNVVVAVVDNAVLVDHLDLTPSLWVNPNETAGNAFDDDGNGYADDVNGADLADVDGDPNPPTFGTGTLWDHGTHCAGIAAAATDNGVGIASLGFGVKLMAVKTASDLTNGDILTRSYEGIDYAINEGADIISLSWGGEGNSVINQLLIGVAASQGVLLVGSGGNNNSETPFYPASYPQVLAVGATDQADLKSTFSNYGGNVDVMAPGTAIYSTVAIGVSDYGTMSGTSMACPLVSALAARLLSADAGLTPADLRNIIESTCVNIDSLNPGYAGKLGVGRIDAYAALLQVVGVGIAGAVDAGDLRVGPNPCAGVLDLYWEPCHGVAKATVVDAQGRIVERGAWTGQRGTMDLGGLAKGVYVVKVEGDGRVRAVRIVKD